MIRAVFVFLTSLPDIIRLVLSLAKLIREEQEKSERAKRAKEIRSAVDDAIQTRSTAKLEEILKRT